MIKVRKIKLAILVNVVAPYRVPVYREIARAFDARIFVSGVESNRPDWDGCRLQEEPYRVKKSWGYTFKLNKKFNGSFFDYKFLHFNPGYLMDLFRFSPDAIISNEMGFRSIAAIIYGMFFRKPVWLWWGGTLHTERTVGAAKRAVRSIFSRVVRRWISYGETSTEYLLSIGVPRDRILQIQNCVDEQIYSRDIKPAFDIHPKPVLLFVGQMIDRKGIEPLLETVAVLQKEGYNFSLFIVGDGPRREDYKRLAQQLGLTNAWFHSSVKPDEMPAVYQSANCLVFPTLEDVWGLVVNEALLSGIPVLSSVYAGCAKEIIPEAYQFDPLYPGSLDSTIRLFLQGELRHPGKPALMSVKEVAVLIIKDVVDCLSFKKLGKGEDE